MGRRSSSRITPFATLAIPIHSLFAHALFLSAPSFISVTFLGVEANWPCKKKCKN